MTLVNVKKTPLKKSEINKITYAERHWLLGKIAKFTIFTAVSQPTGYAVQQGIYDFLTAEEKTYTGNSVQMVDIPDQIRIFRHTDFTEMNKFTCNKFTSFTATTASNRFDYTESIVHR